MPIANARMYSATPAVKADWNKVLRWALAQADLPWEVIDHDAPAPLSALWTRGDLGLAMMCGLPFAQRASRPTLVAAPVPSPSRYQGLPVYFTDIVVAAGSAHQRLEDAFGGVLGYTLADSLSGGVALQAHLEPFQAASVRPLFRRTVGNLVNARGVINALASGAIDVGPLDSYYHDLLKRNDPGFAAQVRVVATTRPLPIPPLVATAILSSNELSRLQDALLAVGGTISLGPERERLLLKGFAIADAASYQPLADMANGLTFPLEMPE